MSDIDKFEDLMQPTADLLDDAASADRSPVVRTRYTEDRAPIDGITRYRVMSRDKFRCVWCGSRANLQMDHIEPWSAGGADTDENLRTLCESCNTKRSNRKSVLDAESSLPFGVWCTRCEGSDVLDDMVDIWCRTCRVRGKGYVS